MATNTNPTLGQLALSAKTYSQRSRETSHKQAAKNVFRNLPLVLADLTLQALHTTSNVVTAYKPMENADNIKIGELLKENELATAQREVLASIVESTVSYFGTDDSNAMRVVVREYMSGLTEERKSSFEQEAKAMAKSQDITYAEAMYALATK